MIAKFLLTTVCFLFLTTPLLAQQSSLQKKQRSLEFQLEMYENRLKADRDFIAREQKELEENKKKLASFEVTNASVLKKINESMALLPNRKYRKGFECVRDGFIQNQRVYADWCLVGIRNLTDSELDRLQTLFRSWEQEVPSGQGFWKSRSQTIELMIANARKAIAKYDYKIAPLKKELEEVKKEISENPVSSQAADSSHEASTSESSAQ